MPMIRIGSETSCSCKSFGTIITWDVSRKRTPAFPCESKSTCCSYLADGSAMRPNLQATNASPRSSESQSCSKVESGRSKHGGGAHRSVKYNRCIFESLLAFSCLLVRKSLAECCGTGGLPVTNCVCLRGRIRAKARG